MKPTTGTKQLVADLGTARARSVAEWLTALAESQQRVADAMRFSVARLSTPAIHGQRQHHESQAAALRHAAAILLQSTAAVLKRRTAE